MIKSFIREKKIYCNDYLEVDIIPCFDMKCRGRKRKEKRSSHKQENLNDKNARRYFIQKLNTNFGADDYHVTVTYKNVPETIEEAEKTVNNFLRRISYHRKKSNLPALKYIVVTESRENKIGKPIRIHHHIVMNGGISRDEIENLWRERRKKGEKKGKSIGFVNVDRLQPDEFGLEALGRYLTKSVNGRQRWRPSRNLKEPVVKKNDYRYSRRKVEQFAQAADNWALWEKQYPGYRLTNCNAEYRDETGWSIYIKMRRDTNDCKNSEKNKDEKNSRRETNPEAG